MVSNSDQSPFHQGYISSAQIWYPKVCTMQNKTIKDGDISPWQLDHNCPYSHMERFDQMEWREHNNWLEQLCGEDRQAFVSYAFAPSARRPAYDKRLQGILCTISYLYIKSRTQGTRLYKAVSCYTRLYLTVLGCIWLFLAVQAGTWLYQIVLGSTRLYSAVPGCNWLYQAVIGCIRL